MMNCVVNRQHIKSHVNSASYVNKAKLGKAIDYAFRKRENVQWQKFEDRMYRYYSVANKKDESTAGEISYLMVHVGQELE